VLLVVALAAGGLYLDRRSRQAEFVALTRCSQAGIAAAQDAEGWVSTMAEYVRPALAFVSSEHTREGLLEMVREAARSGLPGVQRAGDGCTRVAVHGWHADLRAARAAQVAYLAAERDRLETTAANGSAVFTDPDELPARRVAAGAALAAARPDYW
jgi:hypothetical protein